MEAPVILNADDINIRNQFFRVAELILLKGTRMTVDTSDTFSQKDAQLFIDSCLLLVPISSVYIDGSTHQWELIDGRKRLNAIVDFMAGVFPLPHVCCGVPAGTYYNDMEGWLKSRLLGLIIQAHVFTPGMSTTTKRELIRRLRT